MGEWMACRAIADWIHEQTLLHADEPFFLAVEDFVLRRMEMDRTLLSPVRIWSSVWGTMDAEGLLEAPDHDPLLVGPFHPAGVRYCDGEVIVNSAANAKNTFDDRWLKGANLWIRGQRHARDAIRHACLALQMNAPTPDLKPLQAVLAARSAGC